MSGSSQSVSPREIVVDLPEGGTADDLQFFAFDPTTSPPPGRIDGRVWNDRNGNGVRDADEPAVNGILVHFDDNGTEAFEPFERRDRTDVGGAFSFPNTPAGSYRLRDVGVHALIAAKRVGEDRQREDQPKCRCGQRPPVYAIHHARKPER